MGETWYVFVHSLDAYYGQSDDAQLRLVGPFETLAEADDWSEKNVNLSKQDSIALPLDLVHNQLTLRAEPPKK